MKSGTDEDGTKGSLFKEQPTSEVKAHKPTVVVRLYLGNCTTVIRSMKRPANPTSVDKRNDYFFDESGQEKMTTIATG